jgi:hypothetical protein
VNLTAVPAFISSVIGLQKKSLPTLLGHPSRDLSGLNDTTKSLPTYSGAPIKFSNAQDEALNEPGASVGAPSNDVSFRL